MTSGPVTYWADEFGGEVLAGQWLAIPQPEDGLTCYMTGDRGGLVGDDVLTLTVEEDPIQTCDDGNRPMLINDHVALNVAVGYGTTAARIKLPRGRSVAGQFWLQPGDPFQRWVMDAEHEGVVIAETRGTDQAPRAGTSVNRLKGKRVVSSTQLFPLDQAAADGEYHVYAVTWKPDGFAFSIDGEVVRVVKSTVPAPPMTIGMSVVPTKSGLPADPEDRTMYVDWLRVWVP
jgi:hypothetical protein